MSAPLSPAVRGFPLLYIFSFFFFFYICTLSTVTTPEKKKTERKVSFFWCDRTEVAHIEVEIKINTHQRELGPYRWCHEC